MLDLTTCFTTHRLATARRAAVPALVLLLGVGLLSGCSRDAGDPAPDGPDGTSASTSSPATDESGDSGPDPSASAEGDDSDGGSPGADPGTSPGAGPDLTPAEVSEVEASTEDYYENGTVALGEPKVDPEPADYPHVTGEALESLFNDVAEFRDNGWRMVGTPTIVRQRVVRRTTNPDTVVVRACVDNSSVRVEDRFGDEVPNSRPSSPRTLNVLTLVRKAGSWVVTDQRLATNPDC